MLKRPCTMLRTRTPAKPTRAYRQKSIILVALLVGGISGYEAASYRYAEQAALTSANAVIQVRFSPKGNCTQLIREAIAKARKTILVQAYSFTSPSIANALIAAHQRGIEVRILVDRSQLTGKYTQVRHIAEHGIAVAVDQAQGIAHNKVMIIDDDYVLTGSFNWTRAAEKINAENLLLIRDTTTNGIYKAAWYRRAAYAQVVEIEE
jgi:phospholipase D